MLGAVLSLSGIGLVAGVGLAIASKVFAVTIDPKVEAIENALLGTNCGACGFPGCGGLATAIVKGEADINSCLPGGTEVSGQIASIMGVAADESVKKMAVVLCKAGDNAAVVKFDYRGIQDCWAATQVGGGFKGCSYGCLGLGSCSRACPYGAIEITSDRLAIIIPEKCTGCTLCVAACPKNLIKMVPETQNIHVLCSNHDKGAAVKKVCSVGCTACTLCTKKTTNILIVNNLAVTDYEKIDNTHEPAEICPTNTISDFKEAHPLKRFIREKKKPAKKTAKPAPKGGRMEPSSKTGSEAKKETVNTASPKQSSVAAVSEVDKKDSKNQKNGEEKSNVL